ncbi:MAG: YgiT-type zinc finger protein [Mediterraneibacter sp.]
MFHAERNIKNLRNSISGFILDEKTETKRIKGKLRVIPGVPADICSGRRDFRLSGGKQLDG